MPAFEIRKFVASEKTNPSPRKQRLHLVILCSLGVVAILLMTLLVLPYFSPSVPKWHRAHYSAGTASPRPGLFTKQGLHLTRTRLGSMGDNLLWFRVGSNVYYLEVFAPIE